METQCFGPNCGRRNLRIVLGHAGCSDLGRKRCLGLHQCRELFLPWWWLRQTGPQNRSQSEQGTAAMAQIGVNEAHAAFWV